MYSLKSEFCVAGCVELRLVFPARCGFMCLLPLLKRLAMQGFLQEANKEFRQPSLPLAVARFLMISRAFGKHVVLAVEVALLSFCSVRLCILSNFVALKRWVRGRLFPNPNPPPTQHVRGNACSVLVAPLHQGFEVTTQVRPHVDRGKASGGSSSSSWCYGRSLVT